MAFSNQQALGINSPTQPLQPQILERYCDPLDCLTAHLMLECAEVLGGVKPANLISIVNRTRSCGRNIYQLWLSHHKELTTRIADLTFVVLKTKPQALLLLCYNRNQLERHLSHGGIRALLQKAGYETGASCEQLLTGLCRRIEKNDSFPHEVGLFIGYPAKDVAAFMGLVDLPFTCQGPWKIFGKPEQSLVLAEQYRSCRNRMRSILASGNSSLLELGDPQHPFFCQSADNDFQYHEGGMA